MYYKDLMNNPHTISRYYASGCQFMRVEAGSTSNVLIATTQKEIEEVIMSMDHENCMLEILTVDTLGSPNESLFILVTGAMHNGNATRKFVQSFFVFFEGGIVFVSYDILRYLGEESEKDTSSVDNDGDGTRESSQTPSSMVAVPEAMGEEALVAEKPEILYCNREAVDGKQLGTGGATYHQVSEALALENLRPGKQFSSKHDDVSPPPFEVGPAGRMSYAAILQRDIHTLSQRAVLSHLPVSIPRQSPRHNMDLELPHARAHAPTEAKQDPNPLEKKVDLRSVYVKNLPASMTKRNLEAEMSRFGPLQPNQLTLRTSEFGPLYAFVHFKDSTSAQAAIEASPILIGGRTITIEKRTSAYVGDHRRGHGRGPR